MMMSECHITTLQWAINMCSTSGLSNWDRKQTNKQKHTYREERWLGGQRERSCCWWRGWLWGRLRGAVAVRMPFWLEVDEDEAKQVHYLRAFSLAPPFRSATVRRELMRRFHVPQEVIVSSVTGRPEARWIAQKEHKAVITSFCLNHTSSFTVECEPKLLSENWDLATRSVDISNAPGNLYWIIRKHYSPPLLHQVRAGLRTRATDANRRNRTSTYKFLSNNTQNWKIPGRVQECGKCSLHKKKSQSTMLAWTIENGFKTARTPLNARASSWLRPPHYSKTKTTFQPQIPLFSLTPAQKLTPTGTQTRWS